MGVPVLATMGLMGVSLWLAWLLSSVPLIFGILLQLILTAVTERKIILWIPAVLGVLGLIGMVVVLFPERIAWIAVIYWVIYFLFIWLTWLLTVRIKRKIAQCRKRSE